MTPTLSFFFEKSPLGFAHLEIVTNNNIQTTDYVFLEVNPAFETITGLQKTKITGKSVYKVINGSETFNMVFQSILDKISKTQGSTKFEHHMPHSGRWYRINLNPIDEAHIILIMSDITEQKLKEDELLKTKAKLTSIIENSLVSIYALDRNYNLLYLNDTFKNAFYEAFRVWLFPGSNKIDSLPDYLVPVWKERYDKVLRGESIEVIDKVEALDSILYIEVVGNPIIQNREVIGATFFGKDITARKMMSKELSAHVDFNEKLIASMPDAVIQTDVNGTITYINQQVLINYPLLTREDLIGWNFISFVNPNDHDKIQKNFRLMFDKPLGVQEYNLQFGKEYDIICEVNGDVIRDDKGNPVSLIFVVRDITNRRQTELKLEKEKNRFQNLFEHSPIATWLEDFSYLVQWFDELRTQGISDLREYLLENPEFLRYAVNLIQIKDVNQAAVFQTGAFSKQELIEGLTKLFENDTYLSFLDELEVIWNGENEYLYESKSKKVDGSELYVKIRMMVPEIDGKPDYSQVIITGTDMTERKLVQKALDEQSLLQKILMEISNTFINIPLEEADDIIDKSLERIGRFTGSDRSYIFKYDHENRLLNNTYEWCENGIEPQIDVLQQIPMDTLPELVQKHINGESLHIPDVYKLNPDDNMRNLLESLEIKSLLTIPMMNRTECMGFVGFDAVNKKHYFSANENELLDLFAKMIVNLFNRIENQKALNKAVEQANAASKAKSEFLANLSHEIRTPLNAVIGFTDLLKTTNLSMVQKQYVDNANVSGHALLGIINDILDFSKIEAGKLRLEKIETDMLELLENAIDIVKFNAGRKKLELLLDVDSNLPDFALVDPIRLKQILFNLLGNAIKFTDEGEVELKVAYEKIAEGHGNFKFSIRDTGIGISDEQKEKLFRAFSQADSSTTRKFGGTGLGLIISDMIAQEMDSKIFVESTQGQGSVFWFEIMTTTSEGKNQKKNSLENIRKCLIVDDNEHNRIILQHMLASWNVNCTSTDNGNDAIQLLENSDEKFDVIICDFNMPGIDGLETILRIRKISGKSMQELPIILLHSSSDDAEMHKRCNDAGVRYMLTKPVKSTDLYAYLSQAHKKNDFSDAVIEIPEKNLIHVSKSISDAVVSILIAEDVGMNMLMIKALLSKFLPNAKFFEAENGLHVIRHIEHNKVDLIFMDVQMPVMDGLEATRKLRKMEINEGRYTPVIALTAGAFRDEKLRCTSAGMDDFLTKPIEPEKIKNVLMKYLKL